MALALDELSGDEVLELAGARAAAITRAETELIVLALGIRNCGRGGVGPVLLVRGPSQLGMLERLPAVTFETGE